MKIYLHGRDNMGWSIDSDHMNTKKFLKDIGHTITNNILRAELVHSVWWNQLLEKKYYLLRFKRRVIATATNEIRPDNPDYLKAKKFVTLWIAPSIRQFEVLRKDGVNVAYQPFYVDEKVFRKHEKSKEELANLLGIHYGIIKDKLLIGSFQRDTLGADLMSPKWQKSPETLIQILSLLPARDKWLLILAGPRRHFIINECEKKRIPYLYYGVKPLQKLDDITLNNLDQEKMALLYNLIDCYIVTSKSEGGPKAILEASFSKTFLFSTNVGFASDILDECCIYDNSNTVVNYLCQLIKQQNADFFEERIMRNFVNVNEVCSYKVMRERWNRIYEKI